MLARPNLSLIRRKQSIIGPTSFTAFEKERHSLIWQEYEPGRGQLERRHVEPVNLATYVPDPQAAEFANATASVQTGKNEVRQCRSAIGQKSSAFVSIQKKCPNRRAYRDAMQASPRAIRRNATVVPSILESNAEDAYNSVESSFCPPQAISSGVRCGSRLVGSRWMRRQDAPCNVLNMSGTEAF
jgi:hypothetical protein